MSIISTISKYKARLKGDKKTEMRIRKDELKDKQFHHKELQADTKIAQEKAKIAQAKGKTSQARAGRFKALVRGMQRERQGSKERAANSPFNTGSGGSSGVFNAFGTGSGNNPFSTTRAEKPQAKKDKRITIVVK